MANRLNGYKVAVLAVDGFDAVVLPGGVVNGDTIRLLPQAQAFVKADDAQLKAAATHALPTIKRHLAMAQQLAGAMKGSP
jgi:putative intracellular protease/amidase